jgi:hypothetical protein
VICGGRVKRKGLAFMKICARGMCVCVWEEKRPGRMKQYDVPRDFWEWPRMVEKGRGHAKECGGKDGIGSRNAGIGGIKSYL